MGGMGRVGLVLGAGGVVGHGYHAGVLSALARVTGWDARGAEIVVGTSAGASFAAYLRGGISAYDMAAHSLGEPISEEARGRMTGVAQAELPEVRLARQGLPRPASPSYLARAALTPWRYRIGVLAAAALPEGRLPTASIGAGIRPLFGDTWPERDLWLCAVRLGDGRLVVFGREGAPKTDVATAVEASCAVPAFFAPVVIDGQRYVDGGAHSPTNLDLLAHAHLDLILVSSPLSAVRGVRPRRFDEQARRFHSYRLGREVEQVRAAGTEVVVFQPTAEDLAVMGSNGMDAARRAPVVRQAHQSTLRRLERVDVLDRLTPLSK